MTTNAILDQVQLRLSAPDGTGTYNYDLSATGVVIESAGDIAFPTVPMVLWAMQSLDEEDGPELGDYQETATIVVACAVPATADTAKARRTAVCNVVDDIKQGLRADRGLSDQALDAGPFLVTSLPGEAFGLGPAVAAIYGQITIRWWEDGT